MARIDSIEPEQAQDELAEFFETVQSAFGVVPDPLKVFAHHPAASKAVFEGFAASMAQSSLSPPFFAWVRYLVAKRSDCPYCVDVNAGMLIEMGVSQAVLAAALDDPANATLDDKEKALLLACLDVVHGRLDKDGIDRLKALGLTDADLVAGLHHAVHSHAADLLINAFGL